MSYEGPDRRRPAGWWRWLDYRTFGAMGFAGIAVAVVISIVGSNDRAHDAITAQRKARIEASRRIDMLTRSVDNLTGRIKQLEAQLRANGIQPAPAATVIVTAPQPATTRTFTPKPEPTPRRSPSRRPPPPPTRSPSPSPSPSPSCTPLPLIGRCPP